MIDFTIVPKSVFSFQDWSYGYIFHQLYQITKSEYGNSFYLYLDSEVFFISSKFKIFDHKSTINKLHFFMEVYNQNKKNELILEEDPNDYITKKAKETIIKYLGAEEDLSSFYKFANEFDELSNLQNVLPGYRLSSVLMREWMPILGFLSTNTTVDMYHTFLKNFLLRWGIQVKLDKSIIPSFPPLMNLINLQDDDYRKTKIGYRSKYMPELINNIVTKKLPLEKLEAILETEDIKRVLKYLQESKGIGDYTARCILLYGFRNYSVGFVDSFIKIIMNEYFKTDKKVANKELMKIIDDKFYPYQGLMIDWLTAISKDKFFILKQ